MATNPIMVSPQFKDHFDQYCKLYGMGKEDIAAMRDGVRKDYEGNSSYIEHHMSVHQWMLNTWGYIPHYDLLIGYLASQRAFVDPKKYGFSILASFCYDCAMSENCIQT